MAHTTAQVYNAMRVARRRCLQYAFEAAKSAAIQIRELLALQCVVTSQDVVTNTAFNRRLAIAYEKPDIMDIEDELKSQIYLAVAEMQKLGQNDLIFEDTMFKRWFKPRNNHELDELYLPYNRFASMARRFTSNNKLTGRKRKPRQAAVPSQLPALLSDEPCLIPVRPWLMQSMHEPVLSQHPDHRVCDHFVVDTVAQWMTSDSAWYAAEWQFELSSARRFYKGCNYGSLEAVFDSLHEIFNAGMAVAEASGHSDVHNALHSLRLYLDDRGQAIVEASWASGST